MSADFYGTYQFPLATLLAKIPIGELPEEVQMNIYPVSEENVQAGLKPFHEKDGKQWYLCGASEELLLEACDIGMTMKLGEHLLLKTVGRMTALCTKSFTTKDGFTFVEGVWYSPIDQGNRDWLKNEFDHEGSGKVDLLPGTWVTMRSLWKYKDDNNQETEAEEVLMKAKDRMDDHPDRIEDFILGEPRALCRKHKREPFPEELAEMTVDDV